MNRYLTQTLALTLGGAMGLSGNTLLATPGEPEADLMITIHVYNYARIPGRTLLRTKRQVASIFLSAGIQLVWMDCIPPSEKRPILAVCPGETSPSELILNIVSKFDAKAEGLRDGLFGIATGYQATIVIERIGEIIYKGESTPSEVLGITISHELGHLLLGPNSHTENGIMSPRWAGKDFRTVQSTTLAFTQGQAEQMRHIITQRNSFPAEGK